MTGIDVFRMLVRGVLRGDDVLGRVNWRGRGWLHENNGSDESQGLYFFCLNL